MGISTISCRFKVIKGWLEILLVISFENNTRSTASAEPAGTQFRSPDEITIELKLRSSSLRIKGAEWGRLLPKELLQTNSAQLSVLCAAVRLTERISYKTTGTPLSAACQAASDPANPAPIMVRKSFT